MVFLSICTAVYDYAPQGEGELELKEGELVYIIEKSGEDDWWKAKKKAPDDEEDEPVGLIPNNYVEEARPKHHAKALYDYSRQTDEELSFGEDAALAVFDSSDPDWTLVGLNGEYGFAPANYIEITSETEGVTAAKQKEEPASPALPARPAISQVVETPPSPVSAPNPAANLASIIGGRVNAPPPAQRHVQFTPEASDEDEPLPSLPRRPISHQASPPPPVRSPSPPSPEPVRREVPAPINRPSRSQSDAQVASPGGYHLYNVNEMVSVMGKQKKMPTTLGINLATGLILIIPEKKRDGPQQEWTGEKLMHYSIEGKHVFMELVKPSKSIDFHAGAKDTAQEIVASLGELAGFTKAEGLREVIAAGNGGQKQGRMLYDFMAQGEDEVTVADGDEVIILDDSTSEEWWKVRRVRNGKEGVVPSSYVENTGVALSVSSPVSAGPSTPSFPQSLSAGKSTIERNREEEQRMTRESIAAAKRQEEPMLKASEVGPGLKLPNRGSSLMAGHDNDPVSSQRNKRDSRVDGRNQPAKSKPDLAKIRTWTDRSNSFRVDAQFIGLKDGKIHLHKVNGVKIAVPVIKMAPGDLEYVERVTGRSLDEDKPLSDFRGQKSPNSQLPSGKPDYDWFDFFLKCGVSPYQCERYGQNFNKDSMDESVLPEITAPVLRNLGIKEGDILRIMKYLDNKYGRNKDKLKERNVSFGGAEVLGKEDGEESPSGIFSGPGGTLKNNTRKGRPAPPVQTNDTVDPSAFKAGSNDTPLQSPRNRDESPEAPAPKPPLKDNAGFDDDAWNVKPSSRQASRQASVANPAPGPKSPPPSSLTGNMADLSLLSQPLVPVVTHTTGAPSQQQQQAPQQAPMQIQSQSTQQLIQPQPTQQQIQSQQQQQQQQPPNQMQGATPAFFSQLQPQQTGLPQQQQLQPQQTQQIPVQMMAQPTGQFTISNPPRQRPTAPSGPQMQQGTLMPPPPLRPLSAPQNAAQSNFAPPPLQPQLTGAPSNFNNQMQQMGQQQQQFQPMQPQPTGFVQQGQISQFANGFSPQQTGFQPQQQQMQPQMTGMPPQFGQQMNQLQPQPTGYQPNGAFNANQQLQPQPTGINSTLPPALQPQPTGANGFNNRPGFGQPPPPVPALPQQFGGQAAPPMPPMPTAQQTLAPLMPQKTGPAPSVQFGVAGAKKLVSQPTGKKANLAQATPDNPFGF